MADIILVGSMIMLFLTASTCSKNKPDCHSGYYLTNNSPSAIYSGWSTDSTLINLVHPPAVDPATYKCAANSQKRYGYRRDCFEDEMQAGGLLHIFIFDADVLEANSWQTVKENYMLLKRYSLTKAQLDSINWNIAYP